MVAEIGLVCLEAGLDDVHASVSVYIDMASLERLAG